MYARAGRPPLSSLGRQGAAAGVAYRRPMRLRNGAPEERDGPSLFSVRRCDRVLCIFQPAAASRDAAASDRGDFRMERWEGLVGMKWGMLYELSFN